MRISIGQLAVLDDKSANLEAIARATAAAASDGAQLVVFPELAMYFKHGLDGSFLQNAEHIPGEFSASIDNIAKENNIAVAVGMLEAVAGEDRAFNTIYVTSSKGTALARYRKVHLYDAFGLRESDVIAPSLDGHVATFDLEGLRFGLMTCYDLRFPESARSLVDAGAQVLLIPSAWTPGVRKEDHWETLVRARAIENTSYVVAPNQAPPLSTGSSLIVDPMGIVLAQLAETPETRTAEITLRRVEQVRTRNPSIANRRFRVERIPS
ncbi:carbon-nitrogen hydrolase family protein [Arthrobacter sp. SD76]|uniref:carbon-nitrogen hydrolase family protein n=1 Tax=Arthrobacter sp. SD76 TaxID=3415007 RepID=UPI003C7856C8